MTINEIIFIISNNVIPENTDSAIIYEIDIMLI